MIGSGIEYIGTSAFYECTSLESVTIKRLIPPSVGESFYNFGGTTYPIYVPAASVDTYKEAIGWREYADRIKAIPA